jgi:pimeloyl-[acyl-carrier protein] synthase
MTLVGRTDGRVDVDPMVFDSEFFGPAAVQDPYPLYESLRRHNPICWSQRLEAVVLSGYDDVNEAYRSRSVGQGDRSFGYVRKMPREAREELHPLCPYMPRFISFLDPPDHRRQRDLVAQVFRPKVIEAMRGPIQMRVTHLLDAVPPDGQLDGLTQFALPLASLTACELVGVPVHLRDQFIAQVMTIFSFLGSDLTDVQSARAAKAAYAWITSEMLARLHAPAASDDLVGSLGRLVAAGEAAEADACGILVGLVQGGFETTTTLISNAIFTLLSHPDSLDRVRQNGALLPSAIVEVLRYEGSFKYVMRQAYEDIELGGERIKAGTTLALLLGAANRDPAAYPDPDLFDVARDGRTNLAFGVGPHFCLGAPLARMQAEIAVGTLIARYAGLRLTGPCESYRWRNSALLRQLEALPIRIDG